MAARRSRPAARSAARAAAAAPGKLRKTLVAASWWIGCAGLIALVAVGALALMDEATRPVPLEDDALPTAAVGALATASALGWGCMQRGQERVRRRIGRPLSLVLFVILPLTLTALGFADERAWTDLTEWPRGDALALAVRWVPPALVAVGLVAFLTWRARPRNTVRWGRGAWWALLVLPYVALVAVASLRVPVPVEVGSEITDSLGSLGRASMALQLALAHFLRDAGSG